MGTILAALKDSLSFSAKLFYIILPFTISYKFLKHKQSIIGKKRLAFLGIARNGFVPLVTRVIVGLTYGPGVIIQPIRTSSINKKECFLVLLFLSMCIAIIEDTLVFVVIGANGFALIVFRFFLAIVLTVLDVQE
jgi:hypothetical protein